MIWGYDYGAQLFVSLTLLVIVLGGHFIRLYIKRKKGDNANDALNDEKWRNTRLFNVGEL